MKKFYCLFVLLATMSAAFAADSYLPILKEGRNWRYTVTVGGVYTYHNTYLAHGTKEVDGKAYTKIFLFGEVESASDMIVENENDYICLAREEEGKVYYRTDDFCHGISELLVMDMSLTSVDSVPNIEVNDLYYPSFIYGIYYDDPPQIDIIILGGVARKRLLGWIEGVGTTDTRDFTFINPKISDMRHQELLGCYDGDELICGSEAFGMAGIEELTPDSPTQDVPAEYYNLQGIRVTEPAAGGIYIRRQGSKVSKIKF